VIPAVRVFTGHAAAFCAAALLLCASPPGAVAQPVPRIKAEIVGFDGHTLTLKPLRPSSGPAPAADGSLSVTVLPGTRYAVTAPALLADIQPGDYAGAAVTDSKGRLTAQEVFLYPPDLAGTGEGRFVDGGRLMINGKVTGVSASQLVLGYRGAAQNGKVCEGRASPPAIAGPLACNGAAKIGVPRGTPVMALSLGDVKMLSPGAVVTLAMARNAQGDYVTPGVVIQGAAVVENPVAPP
jgi:hypothetical protein